MENTIKKLLDSNGTLPVGLDVVRVLTSGIIFSFGLEIFDADQMAGYAEWLAKVRVPFSATMARVGKICELVGGVCLAVGFLTRISAACLMITMSVITFVMLDGSLRTDSFYLLLLFACFFFVGGGRLSIDLWMEKRRFRTVR